MASTSKKRKHTTLTISQKCEILDKLKDGVSLSSLAQKYGVGKSTIFDIKSKEEKIRSYVVRTEKGPGVRKTLKAPENLQLEDALFTWFIEQRRKNVPLSGEILMEKAKYFHGRLGRGEFSASKGWLEKFKKRHGIRQLKISGEKLSNNEDAVKPFQDKFMDIIKEKDLTAEQIYNADESGLYWKTIPEKTLASELEVRAPGSKVSKERITFMPCANAAGTHKLPLLVIGKAQKPRAFASLRKLPVNYMGQRNAWVTRPIFLEWLKGYFIPEVKKFLSKKNLPLKALLLLDNAPAHPLDEDLQSIDENFTVLYMPPNCTALIQPMDQNVIQNVKVNYKKKLLLNVFAQQELDSECTVSDVLKKTTMKDAVFTLAESWNQLNANLIKKSWSPLWPQLNVEEHNDEDFEPEDDVPLAFFVNRGYSETEINDFLLSNDDLNETEPVTDDEIIRQVTQECDGESEEMFDAEAVASIPHSSAVSALNTCLEWADQVDIPVPEKMLLRKLRDKAFYLSLNKSRQTKIFDFFKKVE